MSSLRWVQCSTNWLTKRFSDWRNKEIYLKIVLKVCYELRGVSCMCWFKRVCLIHWKLDVWTKINWIARYVIEFLCTFTSGMKTDSFTGSRKKLSRKDNLAIFRGISWFKDGIYEFVQKENTKAKGEKAKTWTKHCQKRYGSTSQEEVFGGFLRLSPKIIKGGEHWKAETF